MADNPENLAVDCGRLDQMISEDLVVAMNLVVTGSEETLREVRESGDFDENFLEKVENIRQDFMDDSPELEFSRSEDHFSVLNRGILGNLVEVILPLECKQNNDVFHLTALIFNTLAESQVFGDGNKRTSYIVGSLFLLNHQKMKGVDGVYPVLNQEFTSILQDIAVREESQEFLEEYLRKGLEERIS